QADPQRAAGHGRGNLGDRLRHWLAIGLVDELDLRPDHQVSIGRRDHAVFELRKMNDWVHSQKLGPRWNFVNYKLYFPASTINYPARDDLRSPVTAFSAALVISDA